MKIGLDIHGVITKNPTLFAKLTSYLILHNHEVHILTGVEDSDRVRLELSKYGIAYTDFFSITTYHKSIGTPMKFKDGNPSQPIIDDELWNITKAHHCCAVGIDLHIDDSSIYGKYFHAIDTQYIQYNEVIDKFLILLMEKL